MYVTDTELAGQCGIDGYYVRIAAPDEADAASPKDGFVPIKNRPPSEGRARAALTVSPDALALVRFGLRAADDFRITNTVAAIDALLKVDTRNGPAWRRYNGDGYGEHDNGRPFDGTGIGRPWPLLTGERAQYELAAGRPDQAIALARAMEGFAGESQLLPEQVWDGEDIPDRELFNGGATGSARPLVWAHAEYIKLRRSIADGAVFDRPPQTVARYLASGPPPPRFAVWRFNNKIRTMPGGAVLRIETLTPAVVHVGCDGWTRTRDIETIQTGLGVWVADLDPKALGVNLHVDFTFFWPRSAQWEGTDFLVACN
jgi:glucoamylase